MKVQGMINILLAYENGEQIQHKVGETWVDSIGQPNFNFSISVYRIKPKEPREFYLRTKDQIRWEGALTDDCNPVEGSIKVVEVVE